MGLYHPTTPPQWVRRRWFPTKAQPLPPITTEPFKNNTGTVLASTSIPFVLVVKVSDGSTVLSLTGQATDGSGVLTIANAALAAGTEYLVVTWDSGAAAFGCEPYTAA